ncbi:MAG: family 78 glycoside hydrolase catalytic domain, partial [Petrimonas sp.]|uniref:family 78 glycoside hydrolase catalytic domain n=1 Tax=Petrimonas sp. TaxID=2023866 RepID=UPI002B39C5CE|nr:family 78 glycoside hydrolase catalytic domain [Petrimonas sp.]
MNKSKIIIYLILFFAQSGVYSQVTVKNLKCEYLDNPVGLDETHPRFTWQMELYKPGNHQLAYELAVGTTEADVVSGKGNVWESGIVDSSVIPVVYGGRELNPFTRYFWSVRVKDEHEQWSSWSQPHFFETGMMSQHRWKGKWITDTYDFNVKPAAYFRRAFKTDKTVSSARIYIAAAGLYELSINGKRIGDHRLDPSYTRFDRRNLYVTYDVTGNLQRGENVLGVLLGNGWYNHQSTAVWYFDKAPWRARPKFCMDLHITYSDGSKEVIATDERWTTSQSPVIFNSIYTAEHYDARKEQPGWDTPDFDAKGWKSIYTTGAPSQNIVAQALHPIRNVREYQAVSLKKIDEQTWLYDFGQNMSGVTRMKINGPQGTTIRLKHVERLDPAGRADMSNIDVHYRPTDDSDPFQTDILILSGKKEDEFMPRFNYKGFQYVEVTSDNPLNLSKENLTAYFMHSDVPPAGKINSSNNTLNKAWQASNASYLSNLFGYPTDCPQREKNGWTGDAH